jgi:hypothetical protein
VPQVSTIRTILIVLICSIWLAARAAADSPRPIDIPPGDLIDALESLTRHTNVSLGYQASQLTGLRTRGATGTLTAQQAVTKLIQGTQLQLRVDSATGAMLIEPAKPHSDSIGREVRPHEQRLAQAENATHSGGPLQPSAASERSLAGSLDEVVVTYLSPLGWEHINLTGDYHWQASSTLGPDQFRPLRTRVQSYAAAA